MSVSGTSSNRSPRPPGRVRGHISYLLAWLIAGAALVGLALLTIDGGDAARPSAGPPPVRQSALAAAMRGARCGLRGRRLPRDGAAGSVVAGVRRAPLNAAQHAAAMADRIIVIEYRSGTDPGRVSELTAIQRSMPTGTILAPAGSRAGYAMRASAYGRELRCAVVNDAALDAMQLFRGRFVGTRARRG